MLAAAVLRRLCRTAHHGAKRSFSAQQKPQQAPWLLLSSPATPESRYLYELTQEFPRFHRELSLPEISGQHLIGSSQGYILSIDAAADIHAVDPLTGAALRLPPTAALPNMADVIRDSSGNLTEYVSIPHYSLNGPKFPKMKSLIIKNQRGEIETFPCQPRDRDEAHYFDLNFMRYYYTRAILSPSLDLAVVIHNGRHKHLACAQLGPGSSSWRSLHYDHEGSFEDVIFHGGRLHAIDANGTLTIFDLDTLQSVSSPRGPVDKCASLRRSVVESPDGKDLYLVYRELFPWSEEVAPRTRLFEVFKLDKDTYKWRPVKSVKGIAMFLGSNCSFSLSACDFPSLKPDCIYFTDDYRIGYIDRPDWVIDTGIYSLEDGSFEFFELRDGDRKLHWPPPIWFMPDMPAQDQCVRPIEMKDVARISAASRERGEESDTVGRPHDIFESYDDLKMFQMKMHQIKEAKEKRMAFCPICTDLLNGNVKSLEKTTGVEWIACGKRCSRACSYCGVTFNTTLECLAHEKGCTRSCGRKK